MTDDPKAMPSAPSAAADASDGTLLAMLLAAFWVLFTLVPGSSTLIVAWPWVFLWQVGLALPVLWLLWQLWHRPVARLGHGFDGVAGLAIAGIVVSTLAADFAAQARWYGWAALAAIAAVYALANWLRSPGRILRLLRWQGYLVLAFIALSLGLWVSQIYLPELARLADLQDYGVSQSFSLGLTSLRNWQPIGHQNYGAGYLVLGLPLLAALAWVERSWQRWLWLAGLGLGLVNLYTTGSRGGWLALMVTGLVAVGVAALYTRLPRPLALALGGTALGLLALGLVANRRLWTSLGSILQGNVAGGELSYRVITNTTGWRMGLARPWAGLGPGSVPLLYQQYRPHWAGRDAELQFQLHSTPAQLWAEFGLWGVVVPLALVAVLGLLTLGWMRRGAQDTPAGLPPVLAWALLAGLLAFGLMGLTDYQLDIPAIAAALVLYLAVLARTFHPPELMPEPVTEPSPESAPEPAARGRHRWGAIAGLGLTLAVSLWLVPVHRAWATASGGFAALAADPPDVNRFATQLEQAHALAPWQPYYPHQLGYNLGELSLRAGGDPPLRQALLADAVLWLQLGNRVSPHQEFGHSNLGWMHLENGQPNEAREAFEDAIALVPAKVGLFFGLGVACAQQGDRDCAIEALALEMLRHPALLTSPLWQTPPLAELYTAVGDRLVARYGELLQNSTAPALTAFLHRARGSLHWWRGDLAAAAADWQTHGGALQRAMLALAQGGPEASVDVSAWADSPAKYALLAWQSPDQRQSLLERAWVTQPEDVDDLAQTLPPPPVIAQLVASMEAATDFTDWLTRTAPSWQPRNERLGFGVLSRNIDGPTPKDFLPQVQNIAIVKFFEPLFPSPVFMPALDNALAPYQRALQAQ